ncbi:MAG: hypothetical protein H0W90_11715 [Actinobacteria bacterium]|nr:hypothetical protein [Actinomycetota bacterium]
MIDLHMPRLDGVSAVARLRRDHPSMCVIVLTGDEEPAAPHGGDRGGSRRRPDEGRVCRRPGRPARSCARLALAPG